MSSIELSASRKYPPALGLIAYYLAYGNDDHRDIDAAENYAMMGIQYNDPMSQFVLYQMLEDDMINSINEAEGLKLLEKSCQSMIMDSCEILEAKTIKGNKVVYTR